MKRRTRKFIGTVVMLAFVMLYGPIAMALAESRILETPKLVQAALYLVLGLAWVLPMLPLIKWMQRPDAGET
jgi:predicted membrane channel-forming protein YqfA (hemolysin III family)